MAILMAVVDVDGGRCGFILVPALFPRRPSIARLRVCCLGVLKGCRSSGYRLLRGTGTLGVLFSVTRYVVLRGVRLLRRAVSPGPSSARSVLGMR